MSEKTAQELQQSETDPPEQPGWSYNPNPSEADYNAKFRGGASQNTDAAAKNDPAMAGTRDSDSSRRAVQDGEKKAVGDTVAGKAATAAASGVNPVVGAAVKALSKIKTKGGSTATVVAILMILLVVGGSIIGGSLAPIAFMKNVFNDLNDQLGALDIRDEKILRTKIKATRDDVIKGCTKVSIRCKLRSVSAKDAARLKEQGIEIKGKTIGVGKAARIFPDEKGYSIEIDGKIQSMTAVELADIFRTRPDIGNRFRLALNKRFFGFFDPVSEWVIRKVGGDRSKPSLVGDTDEERAKSLATGKTGEANLTPADFEKVGGPDSDEYRIKGSPEGSPTFSGDEVRAITQGTSALAGARVMPSSLSQLANLVNIVGYADMACTFKNLLGASVVAGKWMQNTQLAAYALPVTKSVFAITNGDGTVADGKAVGDFFSKSDNRKQVFDIAKTMKGAGSTPESISANLTSATPAMSTNPYYGKTAMDSTLYKTSVSNTAFAPTPATQAYSLGLSTVSFSGVISSIVGAINLTGILSQTGCGIIQSWAVRGVGFIVGAIAAMFSSGSTIALNVTLFVGISLGFVLLANYLNSLTRPSPVPDDVANKPEEKAAATWTGIAALSGSVAGARGMIPGNTQQLTTYSIEQKRVAAIYNSLESQSVSPLDTRSNSSLVGKIALALYQNRPTELSTTSLVASVSKMVSSGYTQPLNDTVYATTAINPNRLTQCEDEDYKALGLNADVQCNLRYYLPSYDLNLDPDDVAVYMEKNGYVEKDTVSGMPSGYTPPSPDDSSSITKQFLVGVVNSFYDTRNYASMDNEQNPHGSDYAKFLDYCVYRSMPYGNTYEEVGAFGSADADWKSGKRCLEQTDQMAHFRIYTFDRSTLDITETPSPENFETTPPGNDDMTTDGWVMPVRVADWSGPFGQNVWGSCSVRCRHAGIDIGVGTGTTVLAAHDGVIKQTNTIESGYGGGYLIQVTKNGAPTNLYYAYQHMSSAPLSPGTTVTAGKEIGQSGCSGACNGPHLHFSIEKGPYISSYADGQGVLDLDMKSLPPLCFLPTTSIKLGDFAPATTGTTYCAKFGLSI